MTNYIRVVATILAAVATSLAPTYGHDWWYAIIVGAAGALALAAPSVIPAPKTPTVTVNSSQETHQ
jgi:hypothetical protein